MWSFQRQARFDKSANNNPLLSMGFKLDIQRKIPWISRFKNNSLGSLICRTIYFQIHLISSRCFTLHMHPCITNPWILMSTLIYFFYHVHGNTALKSTQHIQQKKKKTGKWWFTFKWICAVHPYRLKLDIRLARDLQFISALIINAPFECIPIAIILWNLKW